MGEEGDEVVSGEVEVDEEGEVNGIVRVCEDEEAGVIEIVQARH